MRARPSESNALLRPCERDFLMHQSFEIETRWLQAGDEVVLQIGSKEGETQDLAIVWRLWCSLDRRDSSFALGHAVRFPQRANERRIGMGATPCSSGEKPPAGTKRTRKR